MPLFQAIRLSSVMVAPTCVCSIPVPNPTTADGMPSRAHTRSSAALRATVRSSSCGFHPIRSTFVLLVITSGSPLCSPVNFIVRSRFTSSASSISIDSLLSGDSTMPGMPLLRSKDATNCPDSMSVHISLIAGSIGDSPLRGFLGSTPWRKCTTSSGSSVIVSRPGLYL